MDLTVLKGQNTKKPTTIAKSMSGRIKTKHPFISDFHFLAASETDHPKKSYFDFISKFIIIEIRPILTLRPMMIMFLCHQKLIFKQIDNA